MAGLMGADVLAVFVKEPRPGAVKSRLAAALGAEAAAEVYRAIAEEAMRRTAPRRDEYDRIVAFDPPSAGATIGEWLGVTAGRPRPRPGRGGGGGAGRQWEGAPRPGPAGGGASRARRLAAPRPAGARTFDCTRFEYDGSPLEEARDRRAPPEHQPRLVKPRRAISAARRGS